jgi:hypothetical protein
MTQTLVGLFLNPAQARKAAHELQSIGVPEPNVEVLDAYVTEVDQRLERTGVPEHDRAVYSEGVRRGGALVLAGVEERLVERSSTLMDDFGAVDIDEVQRDWEASLPLAGFEATAEVPAPEQNAEEPALAAEAAVPAIEPLPRNEADPFAAAEDLELAGGVRVRASVVETPFEQRVPLLEEELSVERRPADRVATEADLRAFQGEVLEFVELAEELVVSKSTRVVEELVIKKRIRSGEQMVRESLKQTQLTMAPSRRTAN